MTTVLTDALLKQLQNAYSVNSSTLSARQHQTDK